MEEKKEIEELKNEIKMLKESVFFLRICVVLIALEKIIKAIIKINLFLFIIAYPPSLNYLYKYYFLFYNKIYCFFCVIVIVFII